MSRPPFRRTPMALQWSGKLLASVKPAEVFLSWDPAGSSSTESLIIMTSVGDVLYLPTPRPVGLLTMLPLPSERWSAVDLVSWLNSKEVHKSWPWGMLLLRQSSTQVRVLQHFESDLQRLVPRWRGQRLSLPSTLPFVSVTGTRSHHWRMTSASSCDLCSHGLPLSTW